MADELGTRGAGDVNRTPSQWEFGARRRKASDLAGFLQRRGLTHTALQNMHPALLEHHWRAAGLKSPPSEQTMRELAKHMRPGAAATAGGAR